MCEIKRIKRRTNLTHMVRATTGAVRDTTAQDGRLHSLPLQQTARRTGGDSERCRRYAARKPVNCDRNQAGARSGRAHTRSSRAARVRNAATAPPNRGRAAGRPAATPDSLRHEEQQVGPQREGRKVLAGVAVATGCRLATLSTTTACRRPDGQSSLKPIRGRPKLDISAAIGTDSTYNIL